MSRRTAHNVLKQAYEAAGLNGHLATHSLRKNFAQRLYDRTGDIFVVQEMLGHRNVATTQKYLGVNYASVRQAIEEMAVSGELHEGRIQQGLHEIRQTAHQSYCTATGNLDHSPI